MSQMKQNIEGFKSVLEKQHNIDGFFKALDETLKAVLMLGDDFNLRSYHNSMSLFDEEQLPQNLFMLLVNYNDKEVIDDLQILGDEKWIILTKYLMAKYGCMVSSYNNKKYRPLGVKDSSFSLVKSDNTWFIEAKITNIQGDNIILRDFNSSFIGLCVEITKVLKEIKIYDNDINTDLLRVLRDNVQELINELDPIDNVSASRPVP